MKQVKAGWKSYWKPTPKNLRRFGDALLGVSGFITASAIASQNSTIAYIALGLGIIGKYLSNFFEEGGE